MDLFRDRQLKDGEIKEESRKKPVAQQDLNPES